MRGWMRGCVDARDPLTAMVDLARAALRACTGDSSCKIGVNRTDGIEQYGCEPR